VNRLFMGEGCALRMECWWAMPALLLTDHQSRVTIHAVYNVGRLRK